MSSIKNIERDIRAIEGFSVAIHSEAAKRRNLPEYDYDRAARSTFTVADWKRRRFDANYPDIEVDVLRADGRVATGATRLAKLRAEYET